MKETDISDIQRKMLFAIEKLNKDYEQNRKTKLILYSSLCWNKLLKTPFIFYSIKKKTPTRKEYKVYSNALKRLVERGFAKVIKDKQYNVNYELTDLGKKEIM